MPKTNITNSKKAAVHQSKCTANKLNNEFDDEPIQESQPSSGEQSHVLYFRACIPEFLLEFMISIFVLLFCSGNNYR
jgi:hypothetical protein